MNDPLNTTREAERLEADYMARLHEALRAMPDADARQIVEDVQEHIRAALLEHQDGAEVGLTQMATVLEALGPPEDMARDPLEEPAPRSAPVPPVPPGTPRPGDRAATNDFHIVEHLDRLFAAFAVIILGLYIPVIDLYFCPIIGYALLIRFLRKMADESAFEGIGSARGFAIGALVSTALLSPLGLLGLAGRGAAAVAGLVAVPVVIAQLICDLSTYWIIMGTLARLADRRDAVALADSMRRRRIAYLMFYLVSVMLAVVLGVVLAMNGVNGARLDLVVFCLLPVHWVVGWFFVLSPIRSIARLLRKH